MVGVVTASRCILIKIYFYFTDIQVPAIIHMVLISLFLMKSPLRPVMYLGDPWLSQYLGH